MPAQTLSMTPGAIRARERRAAQAAAAAMPEPFTAEFQTTLDSIAAHAVECGRLDCGHLGKSPSRAVRRAVILYVAEGCGRGITLDLTDEAPEVVAVLGVLRTVQHARPQYVGRGANRQAIVPGVTAVWPNAAGVKPDHPFKITPQRAEVFGYMLRGYSATDISSDPARCDRSGRPTPHRGLTARNIETVKSHAGYLRRETGAHDAVSALLALVVAGRLTDPAMVVA